MTIFEAVKARVTPTMAAERYGLQVGRNGMVCCLFHPDRHPSMKLYDDHYHCFGCQAGGDVIQMVAQLFGLSNAEAAKKLAADFGIADGKPSVLGKLNRYKTQAEQERLCRQVLTEYVQLLKGWKVRYAPQCEGEEFDPRFVEACQRLEETEYLLEILSEGTNADRGALVKDLNTDNRINRLQAQVKMAKEETNE